MIPELVIAHILSAHLMIPEPVKFEIVDLWPSENKAEIVRVGNIGNVKEWIIRYDKESFEKYPNERFFIIAHELCHAAYDYDVSWGNLTKKEKGIRHKKIDACAKQIVREHILESK